MAAKLPERFAKSGAPLHGDAAVEQWRRISSRTRPARLVRDRVSPGKVQWHGVRADAMERVSKRLKG